jgi:flagellar hook-length control protein FliK
MFAVGGICVQADGARSTSATLAARVNGRLDRVTTDRGDFVAPFGALLLSEIPERLGHLRTTTGKSGPDPLSTPDSDDQAEADRPDPSPERDDRAGDARSDGVLVPDTVLIPTQRTDISSETKPATATVPVDSGEHTRPTEAAESVIASLPPHSSTKIILATVAPGGVSVGAQPVDSAAPLPRPSDGTETSSPSGPLENSAASPRPKVQNLADGISSRPTSMLVAHAVLATQSGQSATPVASDAHVDTAPVTATAVISSEFAGTAAIPAQDPIAGPDSAASPVMAQTSDSSVPASPVAVSAAASTGDAGGGDILQGNQGFSLPPSGHPAIGAHQNTGDHPLAGKPIPVQIAAGVGKAARAGLSRIEIALEPASLGRVEVRLDFAHDGRISALFVADSREALDALRADARTLQRALAEAGVKSDAGSLGFSLREQDGGSGRTFAGTGGSADKRRDAVADVDGPSGAAPMSDPVPPPSDRRLDIRA